MSGPLLIGAEGVLLIPDDSSYGASRPLIEGIELASLLRHFPTSRTTILVSQVDTTDAEFFMKVHGLKGADVKGIAPEDRREDPDIAQWYLIERCRSMGPINLVLTAYASVYERCRASYQPVILFGRRGSLGQLDSQPTWDELHDRVLRHQAAEVETMSDDQINQ